MSYKKFNEVYRHRGNNKEATKPVFVLAYKEVERKTPLKFVYPAGETTYFRNGINSFIDIGYESLIQLDEEDLKYLYNKYKFMYDEDKKEEYKSLLEDQLYYNELIEQKKDKLLEIETKLKSYNE